MTPEAQLYDAAIGLIETRLAGSGWRTAAAIRLDDGTVLTGIGLADVNAGAGLCAEVGPLAQAWTEDRAVVASICVNRDAARGTDVVLAPCGLCQERLALWGPDVEVGVADRTAPDGWRFRRLADLMPYYWAGALTTDGQWPGRQDHAE